MGLTKKKSGKALFEVITTYRQKHPGTGPLMPEWMRRREQPAGAVMPELTPVPLEPQSATPPTAVKQPPPLIRPVRPVRQDRPEPTLQPLGEPMVNTTGGRLTLSLNYVTSVVAALGLVLLLVAAFLLGRMTAGDRAAKPTATAPAKPTTPGTPGRTNTQVTERTNPAAGLSAADLPADKYYFLIQAMNADIPEATQREEIDRIVRHCNRATGGKAVPAARVLYVTTEGARMWLAIATQPFDGPEADDKVKDLQKKVEVLGKDPNNPTNYSFKRDKAILIPNKG